MNWNTVYTDMGPV